MQGFCFMMKLILILLISLNVKAQPLSGFMGCGEYLLKGVLVKNTVDTKKYGLFIYKTNVQTKSEMQFVIKEANDFALMSSYLDVPTQMKAHINKIMDGTRNEISHIKNVSIRINNPLNQQRNSGIDLISKKDCP